VYPEAKYLYQGKTTYPDYTPSTIRYYHFDGNQEEVVKFYISEMRELGWEIEYQIKDGDPATPDTISFTSGGQNLTIIIGGLDKENTFSVGLKI
jgi:hypothetical protein